MTYPHKVLALMIAAFLFAGVAVIAFTSTHNADAAFPNLNARIATSSSIIAGPQQVRTIFASRQNCASRNITTSSSSVMISFNSDLLTPTIMNGHWQAASTTVAYDSALWGCNTVTIFGVSSTTVTLSEAVF